MSNSISLTCSEKVILLMKRRYYTAFLFCLDFFFKCFTAMQITNNLYHF